VERKVDCIVAAWTRAQAPDRHASRGLGRGPPGSAGPNRGWRSRAAADGVELGRHELDQTRLAIEVGIRPLLVDVPHGLYVDREKTLLDRDEACIWVRRDQDNSIFMSFH